MSTIRLSVQENLMSGIYTQDSRRTRDAMLTTPTREELDANARRVSKLTALSQGRVWRAILPNGLRRCAIYPRARRLKISRLRRTRFGPNVAASRKNAAGPASLPAPVTVARRRTTWPR